MNLTTMRNPLAVGNIYVNPHDPRQEFKITYLALPDKPHHDGGLPGVSIKWMGFKGCRQNGFYPCKDEAAFWTIWTVSYFISPEFQGQWEAAISEQETLAQIGAGI